ncbi:high affinity copper uptake protein 1-like [Saccoglossus kowalevskii]|uniref:Copper transport protein n=1 Tax=Saccoglossus kowalevskii TaxID=10224 RepID=A0ABM0MFI3_SACKO|nr:PREDICTED: high affinity copper uptake protein 1-like [Saccoglossus kowalevskii]
MSLQRNVVSWLVVVVVISGVAQSQDETTTVHHHMMSTEHEHDHDDDTSHEMKMYFHTDSMVTILFYEWHVMTTGGWIGSCIVIALTAVLYEGLKQLREWLARGSMKIPTQHSVSTGTLSISEVNQMKTKMSLTKSLIDSYHLLQTGLHLVQVTLSYALMLIVMTYSVWLFLSVVLGLTLGYYLFGWKRTTMTDINEHCH